MPRISTSALHVKFSNFSLSLPSLEFEAGERIAILGPSGSGKSTFLKLIAGLPISESKGSFEYERRPYSKRSKKEKLQIAYVSQDLGLIQNLTVLESVLQGSLGNYKLPRIGHKTYSNEHVALAADLLRQLNVEDHFQNIANCSGGQRQRIAIARALMQQPSTLVTDEPVASLDPESARIVLGALTRDDSKLVIAALHQTNLAKQYFDRILGLRNGKLMFDLPSKSVSASLLKNLYHNVSKPMK